MSETLVGSRLPDLRTVIVDLVLRYRMRRGGAGPVSDEGFRRAAARFERANATVPVPPFVSIEPVAIPSEAGQPALQGEWVSMAGHKASRGVILYFHGGGFVMGSPKTHRTVTWRLARATGRRVLAIAYRKAPDHPFPTWVDDGAVAFEWLMSQGYAAADVVFAGDSAGGNLALAVTQRHKRTGRPLPAGLVLFSPWADLGCEGGTYESNAFSEAMFQVANVRATGAYLTRGCAPRDPEASPIHADLTGFPPMLVFAGSREIFLDDARTLTRRASAAGVAVDLHVYRHMPHVFPVLAGVLPRAKPAFKTIERFVGELSRSGPSAGTPAPQAQIAS